MAIDNPVELLLRLPLFGGLKPLQLSEIVHRAERLRCSHPVSTLDGFGRDQAAWAAAVTARQCQGSSSVMRLAG